MDIFEEMNAEEIKHRLKDAITFLPSGIGYKVSDLHFKLRDKSNLEVVGSSNLYYIESVTMDYAIKEIKEVKDLFKEMVNISNELSNFITDKNIEYYLLHDTGKSGVEICKEINGQIIFGKWVK